MTLASATADEIIEWLGLVPHPEGGWFIETYRDTVLNNERPLSTAIYYLLKAGEYAHWHRIDSPEIWHHYAGSPLALTISEDGITSTSIRLGPNLAAGERPQFAIPRFTWQTAEPLGAWTLAGCTVAPGFTFETFELAPPDWRPRPDTN